MLIKDTTTREERIERSRIKNQRIRKMMMGVGYRDEGELFLKSLQNACFEKMNNENSPYYYISLE